MKTEHICSTGLRHGMHITRLTLEIGDLTPLHFHKNTVEVYIVFSGTGLIICNQIRQVVGPGDTLVIEPHTKHQIINTGEEPLIITSCKDNPRQYKDDYTE